MAFDLAAWTIILLVVYPVGRGVLALLGVTGLRVGDRFILATWIGVVVLAVSLLAISLRVALTPLVSVSVAIVLIALGVLIAARERSPRSLIGPRSPTPRAAVIVGIMAVALGAAALASDRVTLYDSLVYHLGLIRWLSERGTVPGIALIHNRLGHVSGWFTIPAAFDSFATGRAANVLLGFALLMVGLQAALSALRVASNRAVLADWFSLLVSLALVMPAVALDAATPSPDVGTNVLIVVAAWAALLLARQSAAFRPRLVPFVIALGACAMKLFAAPAVLATGLYALLAPRPETTSGYVRRVIVCTAIALALVGPFVAANLIASGCPAYPSPVGCLDSAWSVGAQHAADYASYVRDVARWQRRGETSPGASLGWLVPWILSHPIITALAIASAVRGVMWLRPTSPGNRGHGSTVDRASLVALVGCALLGIAFTQWQAPAPRFLYAYVIIVPALALAAALESRTWTRLADIPMSARRRPHVVFAATSVAIGLGFALASQKLNVRTAVVSGARLMPVDVSVLLLPSRPELPARLFRWRVNDVEVFTPVPRPIADTLGYHSVIPRDALFEQCSTAPLPCTPYLPDVRVRLREPQRGVDGGFVRERQPDLAGRIANCLGELTAEGSTARAPLDRSPEAGPPRCGDDPR